jgi:uncharacterized protein (DUF1697 family)
MKNTNSFVALLRGINVGGNKKVPMADLKKICEKMGFKNVRTILATGNVIFDAAEDDAEALTKKIAAGLAKAFGFPIPVIVRPFGDIESIIKADPFSKIKTTEDTRLYVTFLPGKTKSKLAIPYSSPDGAFGILSIKNNIIFSVLDLSKTQTTDAMNIMDKEFGKEITTRNWNTVMKIGKA